MLYLIKSSSYIKVGYTTNINKRLCAYNTCNPDYELIDVVEGSKQDESEFHQLISQYRYKFEWFYYNDYIIDMWNKKFNKTIPYFNNFTTLFESKQNEYYLQEEALQYRENFVLNNIKNMLEQNIPIKDYLYTIINENSINKYTQIIKNKDLLISQMSDVIKEMSNLLKIKN